ncbi:MAG TPA: 3'-5' exonuclease, partial [bacterium]
MANQSLLEGIFEEGFAAFDVETTGLDPQLDEIIEIGMVRLQSGKIVERFQSLYRPSKPIPPNITKLTGIRDVDCADQPPFSQGLGDVLNFLGGRWIVAHNADFDFGFLSNAIQRFLPHSGGVSASRLIDTLSLGRLLMPFLPNHRLETLMEAFGLPF